MEPTSDEQAPARRETPESTSPCLPREWVLLWLLGLALILVVSRQSLWIDEAGTANCVNYGSLREWWRVLSAGGGSNLQSPFFMFYLWCWARIAGDGEWAFRAAGLIWLVPGLVAMASGFRRRAERMAVMLAAVTSAFVWYYAGEARPYAMQLGVSCLVFAALHRLGREELGERRQSRWLSVFLFGFVMLCGINLIGVIWSLGALAAAFILIPRRRLLELWKTGWRRLVFTVLLLVALGLYYAWTLSVGARATALGATTWKTVAFIFYEQLGLTGLGPGRIEMREAGIQTLRPYLLPLAGYFLLLTVLVANGIRQAARLETARRMGALALAVALPALLLLGVGFATHFRVLGRHFAPLMPMWFGLLGMGMAALWGRANRMGRAVLAAYLLLSLVSCLSIRLAVRHERDDYRDAAQYAGEALRQNQVVWWNADAEGARYYRLLLDTTGEERNKAILIVNPQAASLAGLKKPGIVIASKPDIFDNASALAEYLARNHYRASVNLPAFTIWRE
jgi:uncharacterized membrane protein